MTTMVQGDTQADAGVVHAAAGSQAAVFSDPDLMEGEQCQGLASVCEAEDDEQVAPHSVHAPGIPRGNHTHDFDSNGVVHLLGTAFGKLDEFSLAEASSRCRVTASMNNNESTPPLSDSLHPFFTPNLEQQQLPTMFNNNIVFILSKEPRRVFLNSGIGSWFCLDLGPRVSVVPTAITLRRSSSQRRALRNFTVEGSADGEEWVLLLKRVKDQSLRENDHSSFTWPIPATATLWAQSAHARESGILRSYGPYHAQCYGWDSTSFWSEEGEHAERTDGSAARAYRFFRITKTGGDANSAMFMHLSGVEIYGGAGRHGWKRKAVAT